MISSLAVQQRAGSVPTSGVIASLPYGLIRALSNNGVISEDAAREALQAKNRAVGVDFSRA